MTTKPENPPAFPAKGGVYIDQNVLTMRDYFAVAALQGLLAARKGYFNTYDAEHIYRIANAMLAERAKQDA